MIRHRVHGTHQCGIPLRDRAADSLSARALAADEAVARGRELYLEYCGSCHGLTGEGDGPVAHSLTTPPANLRLLSDRVGNPLPVDQVARFIDG
ncbi:MAG TPA: c-type cytochrome, partial [Rhizomicrobium sp.]